ncbi:MAG: hypothetical protein ISS77_02905 [Phycisphaerae bacterium]|nr:hypothetical protein [Phycisphaerae bacterium]
MKIRELRLQEPRGTYKAQRLLASEEAAEFAEASRNKKCPELYLLYVYAAKALQHAKSICMMSRRKDHGSAKDFVAEEVRLAEYVQKLRYYPNLIDHLKQWPLNPGITIAWFVGRSALEVVMEFTRAIKVGVVSARGEVACHGATSYDALQVSPECNPRFTEWQERAINELCDQTIPKPDIWPSTADIHRECKHALLMLEDEYNKVEKEAENRAAGTGQESKEQEKKTGEKQPKSKLYQKLIHTIEQATELTEDVPPQNTSEYNKKISELGGEINALAIACRLANEADPPYKSAMLSWSPLLTIRKGVNPLRGIERLFPEIGRLYTLRAKAKLLAESESQESPKTGETGQEIGKSRNIHINAKHVSLGDNASHASRDINTSTPKPKKEKGGWGKKIGVGLFGLAAIATILAVLFGDNIWGRISKEFKSNKPAIKQIESPKTETKQITENKLYLSLRNICRDIDSRPLAQQAVTEKQYLGLKIKRERLKVLEVEINPGDESIYNLVLTFPDQPTFPNSKWIILGTVSKDQYPQLRIAREGMEFYLSGEIEYTFRRDRVPYIDLSNITLEFE